jgi:hypothetical protein
MNLYSCMSTHIYLFILVCMNMNLFISKDVYDNKYTYIYIIAHICIYIDSMKVYVYNHIYLCI